MGELLRPLLVLALVLAIPIVPFVVFGAALDETISRWARETQDRAAMAALVTGVLAGDILLPVPSSLVSTLAGAKLGVALGTLASWLGMTAGAAAGFAAARRWGAPLAQRWVGAVEWERLSGVARRLGVRTLIVTRPLPVLAEAAVLLLGASGAAWRDVAAPLALSNLGIAAAYAAAGRWALDRGALPLALALSVALPLGATAVARRIWPAAASGDQHNLA